MQPDATFEQTLLIGRPGEVGRAFSAQIPTSMSGVKQLLLADVIPG